MKKTSVAKISAALMMLSATAVRAAFLPSLPHPPPWADTEMTAEADFAPFNGTQSEFKITLAFTASPSNNLEVAIWDGASDYDESETLAVLGWDCGELFVEFDGVRGVCASVPESEQLVITLSMRLHVNGEAYESVITANGVPLEFFDADGDPVIFGFDTAWENVRVVSRGIGAKNERVSFGFSSDPTIIVIR